MPDKKVWIASVGTPGYMRMNRCACTTVAAASRIALDWANQYRDDIDEDCRPMWYVRGNMRWGYQIEQRVNPSLGIVITVESDYLPESEIAEWRECQNGELY